MNRMQPEPPEPNAPDAPAPYAVAPHPIAPHPIAPHPIAVDGLTKAYGRSGEVLAVDHISFKVPRGSVTGLLGGNGAGKTTTIAMLMGLLTPSAGSARILCADMAHERHRVLHRINFESPYVEMPMRLTVRQNLTIFGRLYGVEGLKARIAELAEELALADFLDRPSGKLSAGQKTRVALAKAMVNRPDVLLLDEPTASLDPDTADWVRSHLERYRKARGATLLLASHNMPEVERLCDNVVMMKAGQIVDEGSPRQLIARYGRHTMEDVFLDVARGRRKGEAAP
nr:ABC transporter ATP-binding protein [Afifella pfennigii]